MFKHKFLWMTLILGLTVFSGCSSSDSSNNDTPSTEKKVDSNISKEQNSSETGTGNQNPDTSKEQNGSEIDTGNQQPNTSTENNQTGKENNSSENNLTDVKNVKSMYLSGVAIDGYIDNAEVKIGEHKVKSDKDGKWSFELNDLDENYIPENIVTVSGGIDTATGKVFEGVLSNSVDTDDFKSVSYEQGKTAEKPQNIQSMVITPLTTIVVHTMKNNQGLSKAEANQQVAKSLGLSAETLSLDPVAVLRNGTQEERLEAAKALKHSLVIQKLVESLSKSVSDENSKNGIKFDEVFSAVLSTVAEKLQDGGDSVDFEKVLTEDSQAFAENVTKNIQKDSTLSEEDKAKQTKSLNSKLSAATKITAQVVMVINSIDINTLATKTEDNEVDQFEMISQATEVITSKIESKISAIAQANSEELESIVKSAQDVVNAVVVMGGVKTIATQIKSTIFENNVSNNQTVNTNQFDSLLSDNILSENSAIYNSFQALGISASAILDAVNDVEGNKSVFDLAVSNQNAISKTNGGKVIDQAKVDKAKAGIDTEISKSQTSFQTAANKINIVVIPVCSDNQELIANICKDKIIIPTCTDTQKLVNNVCEDKIIIPTCSSTQKLVNNVCVQKTPTTTNTSVTCIAPFVYNSDKTGCVLVTAEETKALIVLNNQITFKSENNSTKIVTTTNGVFAEQQFDDLNKTSSLSSISFKLGESYFQSGDQKTISVAIKIEDKNSSLAIIAIIPAIILSYNSGDFSIDNNSKVLYGYGVKSNGTALSTSLNSSTTNYLSFDNSNKFTLNYKKVLEKIEAQEKIDSVSSKNIDKYLSKIGTYTFSIYISGVDAFTGMKSISDSEMIQSFANTDFKSNIQNKLISGKTFGIVGLITTK